MVELAALLIGLLFGIGLTVSDMVNPERVIGFFDLAGSWDPTLAFVMGGALTATFVGYRLVLKRPAPLLDTQFHLPTASAIDARLISGAILFGIGWGIGGICPGPGITSLASGRIEPLVFVAALAAGTLGAKVWLGRKS
jgi:uncharacterized membrane protein YedE/YeeE